MSAELDQVTLAVAAITKVEAGLAVLRETYGNVVYDVTTAKGMDDAKAARIAIREPRYEVERIRKNAKAPILALGKKLDSEAARITAELEKIEAPIHAAISAEDARKEAEKQARIDAEVKRVKDIQDRITEIRSCPTACAYANSALIAEHIIDIKKIDIDDSFAEFRSEATDAKSISLSSLEKLHMSAFDREAEAERVKAERAELARLRAEQEARAAEDRRIQAAKDAEEKAARDAEAKVQAEHLRKEREENARIAAEQAAANRAESERVAAERAEVERQRKALADQEAARIAAEQKRTDDKRAADEQKKASKKRPTGQEIIGVLAAHYKVAPAKVVEWLKTSEWELAA